MLQTCIGVVGPSFYYIAIPKLLCVGFSYAQPFLVKRIVSAVDDPTISEGIAGALIGAVAVLFLALAVSIIFFYRGYYIAITSTEIF